MAPLFSVLLVALLATSTGHCVVAGTNSSPFTFAPTTLEVPGPRGPADFIGLGRPFSSTIFATGPTCRFKGRFSPCRRFRVSVPHGGFLQVQLRWQSTRHRLGLTLPDQTSCCSSPLFGGCRLGAAGEFEFAVVLLEGSDAENFELTASLQ